jgi:hypothetical protein
VGQGGEGVGGEGGLKVRDEGGGMKG